MITTTTTTPSPRSSTTARDIVATVRARDTKAAAAAAALDAQRAVTVAIRSGGTAHLVADSIAATKAARDAHRAAEDARAALQRVPRARRDAAALIVRDAERNAADGVRALDVWFSGQTQTIVRWDLTGGAAAARTVTSRGARYSRSSQYAKTDAVHYITLDPQGVVDLSVRAETNDASLRDGLPLLSLRPDGRATWLRRKGNSKHLAEERGWVAYGNGLCYHSTLSSEDAHRGLKRKQARVSAQQAVVAARQAQLAAQLAERAQEERRLALAAAATSVTVSEEDARAFGYCAPGIAAFRARHGITADRVSLADLVSTGDRQAIALAIYAARRAASAARDAAPAASA